MYFLFDSDYSLVWKNTSQQYTYSHSKVASEFTFNHPFLTNQLSYSYIYKDQSQYNQMNIHNSSYFMDIYPIEQEECSYVLFHQIHS